MRHVSRKSAGQFEQTIATARDSFDAVPHGSGSLKPKINGSEISFVTDYENIVIELNFIIFRLPGDFIMIS